MRGKRSAAAIVAAVLTVACGAGSTQADACAEVRELESELIAEFAALPSPPARIHATIENMDEVVRGTTERRRIADEQRRIGEKVRTLVRQNPDCFDARTRLEAG